MSHPEVFEYQPPRVIPDIDGFKKIFLAGSIEMGAAVNWQEELSVLINAKSIYDILIANPRRDDWDSSWTQDISDKNFNEQVNWELDNIETSDLVLFYFDPNTKSPITLMELGIVSQTNTPALVCCPDGFWRKGNIQIMCDKYNMLLVDTKEEFYDVIRKAVSGESMADTE